MVQIFCLVLHLDDETEALRSDDDLLVWSVARNRETTVGGGQLGQAPAGLSALDGLVVEDDLGEFLLVLGWSGIPVELARIPLEGPQGLVEIAPVGEDSPHDLFGDLGVPKSLKTREVLHLVDEHIDARHLAETRDISLGEPRLTHDEVGPVVQLSRESAQPDHLRVPLVEVSFHDQHSVLLGFMTSTTCIIGGDMRKFFRQLLVDFVRFSGAVNSPWWRSWETRPPTTPDRRIRGRLYKERSHEGQ
jgi:hypothetical protein